MCDIKSVESFDILNCTFQRTLNAFMGLGSAAWAEAREVLQRVLSINDATLQGNANLKDRYIILSSIGKRSIL